MILSETTDFGWSSTISSSEIILETLERAGYGDYSSFLCPKEEAIRQSILNEKLYDQESNDIAKAIGTIKK